MSRHAKLLALLIVFFAAACGGDVATDPGYGGGYEGGYGNGYPGGGGGDYGATPGGAQDIEYFRTQVEAGQIPDSSSITVEGLLSEHDLGVAGEPCDELLCLRPALGLAPSLVTGETEYWVQMGMMSGFGPTTFERPPLDLVILIDKSSSMSIDMAETNASAVHMLEHLRPDDGISLVTFDGRARTLMAPSRVGDIDTTALAARIRQIPASGSANMNEGLNMAFENARDFESGDGRMTRVVLLSCGYPNSGDTSTGSFRDMVADAATDDIGFTFVGILLGFDNVLAEALTLEAGGNYYYFNDLQRMEELFIDEFDFVVTPLAYDLKMYLDVDPEHFEIDELYGLPGEDGANSAGFEVSTAFISKRKGAIMAKLTAKSQEPPVDVAEASLSYRPELAHGFAAGDEQTARLAADTELASFDTLGVRKGSALAQLGSEIEAALQMHERGDTAQAKRHLQTVRDNFETQAIALSDADMLAEVDLLDQLIALL